MGGVGGEGAVERKKNKPDKKINNKNYNNPSRIDWRLHAERFFILSYGTVSSSCDV